ncbi:hypothetical protein E4U19_007711 [Claviceps sp. Clav32 group G5]|nr:hypothetical protein E4U19_007711 [Claviceps sp. Clav32 group G5]
MAAADITGSGGIKNARYIRDMDTRGIRDIPAGKNDDQASINPRAKIGHCDLVKSRPGSRGGGRGGSGCDVDVATPAIGATSTETEIQSETVTATGSATVTGSATTVSPMTNFPGQGFAGGKIAVRNEPRHPPATPLKTSLSITQSTITYPPTAPASPSAASAGGNRISTAVAITIGLATVSSLALILAILLYCKVYRRRQRSGCLEAALHSQGNPTNGSRKSPLAIPASSVSILLADLTPSCSNPTRSSALPAPSTHPSRSAGCVRDPATCAPARLARPPVSSELGLSDGQGGASSWWKNYGDRARRVTSMETVKDCNSSPNNQLSTPPPRLMDRNLHPSISSGPNMSISSPISTPVLKEPGPTFRRQGGHWCYVASENTGQNQHVRADQESGNPRTATMRTPSVAASKDPPHQFLILTRQVTCPHIVSERNWRGSQRSIQFRYNNDR